MWVSGTVKGAPVRRVLYLVICLSGCLLVVLLVRARRATREQMTVPSGPGGHARDPVAAPPARVIPLDRPAPAAEPVGERRQTPSGLRVSTEAAIALAPTTEDSSEDDGT